MPPEESDRALREAPRRGSFTQDACANVEELSFLSIKPARLGKELENLGTLQGQRKSRNGPVTQKPIPQKGFTESLPQACKRFLTIRLRISNLR